VVGEGLHCGARMSPPIALFLGIVLADALLWIGVFYRQKASKETGVWKTIDRNFRIINANLAVVVFNILVVVVIRVLKG
jgi:hypothetical protein